MLQIIKEQFYTCERCSHKYSENNYPVCLSCGKTLCKNCKDEIIKFHKPCHFDSSHFHNEKHFLKNLCLINLMDDITKIIKINKEKNKFDEDLNNFLKKLKKSTKNFYQNDEITYNGHLKNNKALGKGNLIHKNIGIFSGIFYGEFHKGQGTINYNDNSYYKGEWENFKRQNKGILKYINQDEYEGEFKDDLFHGFGKLFIKDKKIIYQGIWVNGKKEGEFNVFDENQKFLRKENYFNNLLKN